MPRLLALVDAIGRCVPVSGVSAIGFSNGGLMANALACRAADRVHAIVLVASGYEGLGPCSPSRPVSVLDIHGTSDQVVGYRGAARVRGHVGAAGRVRCDAVGAARREPERVTAFRWHDPDGGSRVEHLRVSGDTHGWPALVDANGAMVRLLRADRAARGKRRWTDGRCSGPQSAGPQSDYRAVADPSFAFSLERVREVRAHEEDRAREAFAASLSVRARGLALLADARARSEAARVQAATDGAPRTGHELIAAQAWLERVQRSEHQAAIELDRSETDVAQRRAALTVAGQRRQALERLKERQREAHRLQAGRREAGLLDEIALNGHLRRAS